MRVWRVLAGGAMAVFSAFAIWGCSESSGEKNYSLIWSDEFGADGSTAATLPDESNWSYETGFVRNHEDQYYLGVTDRANPENNNAYCQGGVLHLAAKKEQFGNPDYLAGSSDWRKSRQYAEYSSACLESVGKREFTYGRVEMRAKIPTANGMWPAFWTLGSSGEWPSCGEIDIMEYYRKCVRANAAWGSAVEWTAQWDSAELPLTSLAADAEAWAAQYHVWRMDWDEASMKLYLDDVLVNTVYQSYAVNAVDTWAGAAGFYPFKNKQYFILNLAVGGDNGCESGTRLDAADFPAEMLVDYVRVYQAE